jgi:uncharacterized protein YdeI (YjbR/CyaY-like superfamily)
MAQTSKLMQQQRVEYYAKSQADWRKWLQKNHAKQNHVWLILYKKDSGIPSLTYDEVVEECLCYGWIDSKPNKRDEQSYFLFIAPRKPKSVWSALNKKRIEKLIAQNKITPAGFAIIEQAKKDGSWIVLDKIEAMEMPPQLKKAFAKNKTALKNFYAFPPSVKKQTYQWIISAKTEATITKRITETVNLAEKNIRANQWKPKK